MRITKYFGIYLYAIYIPIFIIPKTFAQETIHFSKGTTIIGYIKNDTIWIATDSRIKDVVVINGGENYVFTEDYCKIRMGKDFIVTHSGQYSFDTFEVDKTIMRNIHKFNSKTYVNIVDSVLNDFEKVIRTKYGTMKNTMLIQHGIAFLFAFWNKKPQILVHQCIPQFDALSNFSFAHTISTFEDYMCLGKCDCFPASKPETSNIKQLLIDLIKKQSECSGWEVGGEVDIAIITPNKPPKWIQRKENCK
jgi:hypothetical protein